MIKGTTKKHQRKAEKMEWDELAYLIIQLEQELSNLINPKPKIIDRYQSIIFIYEVEKQKRLDDQPKSWKIEDSLFFGDYGDDLGY